MRTTRQHQVFDGTFRALNWLFLYLPGELKESVSGGFSILLPRAGTMRLFGKRLKFIHIAAVPQAHRRLRLILNL